MSAHLLDPRMPMPAVRTPCPVEPPMTRVCARWTGGQPGPTTIIIAALHGNEPKGVLAARRVVDDLERRAVSGRGRVVVLIGNVPALSARVRFLDSDLNRAFSHPEAPPLEEPVGETERTERDALLEAVRAELRAHDRGHEVYAIDLHTFSAEGPPFVVFADTLRNRRFAECWPLPRILGLVEELPGTVTDFLTDVGCISAVVEGGRHDDPDSADRLAAAVRLALMHAGHVEPGDMPDPADDHRLLAASSRSVPDLLDLRLRHAILPADRFRMRPGYRNLAPVRAGEALADDVRGPVLAPHASRILLPLYQAQGSDGYFLARPIGRVWLVTSRVLRRLRAGSLLTLLPGVSRHPDLPNAIVVNMRVARFLATELVHALGYRRLRRDRARIVFVRRRWDLQAPRDIRF